MPGRVLARAYIVARLCALPELRPSQDTVGLGHVQTPLSAGSAEGLPLPQGPVGLKIKVQDYVVSRLPSAATQSADDGRQVLIVMPRALIPTPLSHPSASLRSKHHLNLSAVRKGSHTC